MTEYQNKWISDELILGVIKDLFYLPNSLSNLETTEINMAISWD